MSAAAMSSQAAYDLSIPELLHVLSEKLGLEFTRTRESRLPPILDSVSSLEAEVSGTWSIHLDEVWRWDLTINRTSQIDSLEARARDVLKLIPSLRNLLQPVNRLPPETISRIARYFINRGAKLMIPLTHVCRYWRESIISTPENWASISSGDGNLAVLSLQRAKAAPLDVRLEMAQTREIPGFPDLLASRIQNTEALLVCSDSPIQEFAQIFPNFPQSTPNLRSLSFIGPTDDWDQSIDPFGPFATLKHLSLAFLPLYPSFLHLRTLTNLTLSHLSFKLHLDILLDFLEENRSLECATLGIGFSEPSLRSSRRRVAIKNNLQSLKIASPNVMDTNAFISSIALRRGAHLEINLYYQNAGLNDVLFIFSVDHLPNLRSPTHMEYRPDNRIFRLLGPNGSFSFQNVSCPVDPFTELPPPHLANIRVFHIRREKGSDTSREFPLPPPHRRPRIPPQTLQEGRGQKAS